MILKDILIMASFAWFIPIVKYMAYKAFVFVFLFFLTSYISKIPLTSILMYKYLASKK